MSKKHCNFKEWASEYLGVFHGDALLNVKIRFSKDVAKRAEKVQKACRKIILGQLERARLAVFSE